MKLHSSFASFSSLVAASLFAALSVVACSSSSNGGGGGGNGGACTLTENGNVTSCTSWSNLSSSQSGTLCPTSNNTASASYASVASCPTANEVGTCTYSVSSGGTSYSYSSTFYSGGGETCASVKQACSAGAAGSSLTTSFSGNGC